jgi:hypothetical protein
MFNATTTASVGIAKVRRTWPTFTTSMPPPGSRCFVGCPMIRLRGGPGLAQGVNIRPSSSPW